jgi:hypothetical protein
LTSWRQVTGWFITHCGYNSAVESLSAGVPLYVSCSVSGNLSNEHCRICWDFAADQPVVALTLSSHLNAAYQLFEVRTGPHGLKPIHRTGKAPEGTVEAVRKEITDVLEKMRGADGAAKRANAEKIREELARTQQEGGRAYQGLMSLVADLSA